MATKTEVTSVDLSRSTRFSRLDILSHVRFWILLPIDGVDCCGLFLGVGCDRSFAEGVHLIAQAGIFKPCDAVNMMPQGLSGAFKLYMYVSNLGQVAYMDDFFFIKIFLTFYYILITLTSGKTGTFLFYVIAILYISVIVIFFIPVLWRRPIQSRIGMCLSPIPTSLLLS